MTRPAPHTRPIVVSRCAHVARFPLAAAVAALVGAVGLSGCRSGPDEMKNAARPSGPGVTEPEALESAEFRASASVASAAALRAEGRLDDALAELERAIALNPELTVAYVEAGEIHREQGRFDQAEPYYAEASRREPTNFRAQYGHGLVLQLMGRLQDAIGAYLRALSIDPQSFDANLNLATAFLQIGEPAQAATYAERAVALRPDDGAARANLGATYAALGRHTEAILEYEAAAERMDMSAELLLNLADSYGHDGRYAEMAGTLREVLRRSPSAPAYERLGSALFRNKQYPDALAAFEQAAALDPNHYPAHNGVAVCLLNRYLWSNRTDTAALSQARAAMQRSLTIKRDQPKILDLLSRYGR